MENLLFLGVPILKHITVLHVPRLKAEAYTLNRMTHMNEMQISCYIW